MLGVCLMLNETSDRAVDYVFVFLGEAYMSIGFIEARGAGAFLFTIIAVAFIRSRILSSLNFASVVAAWKGSGRPQPPNSQ